MSSELIGALIGLGGAVFGAGAAGAISLWTFSKSQTAETADEFRAVLQHLIDLRMQWADVSERYRQDPATMEFLSGALNGKRQLYKSTATRMLARASTELTANDYSTLGYEYQADSEFASARRCYELALGKVGESLIERVVVLRSLGGLLLLPTTLLDRSTGEGYLREAVALTNGLTDDNSRFTTGYTYELLGMALWTNRYPEWKLAIAAARENYEAMSLTNPQRASALENLRRRQDGVVAPMLPPKASPERLSVGSFDGGTHGAELEGPAPPHGR